MIRSFAAASAVSLLAACGPSSPAFEIDNPTDAPVQVTIDGKTLEVAAGASTALELDAGPHTLATARTGEVRISVCGAERGTLINPTLSDYVLAREIYVADASKLRNFGAVTATVQLGDATYEGPFEQVTGLFIDRTWDFGVREAFPGQQTVARIPENGGKISTKLFTPQAFIDYVETADDRQGAFAQRHPGGDVQPARALETAPAELPPLPPAFEPHSAPLRESYAQRLQVQDAADCEAVRKRSHEALMAITGATAMLHVDQSPEDNQAYNDVIHRYGRLMGAGALVLPR
ncbi:hypothetical protein [Luteimonas sp. FCS-9]|uniref:hypothetical protein n=1 Tax=Luteimonas sp. FCS-9 TaxID=1547516 RepID=UPI00063ED221|nr:hypothetical protein [Luteimonas sp. FCS-9]KLJ01679.1 hypothetical protein WQ56_05235 [Luteimonas sp. FCS-9]